MAYFPKDLAVVATDHRTLDHGNEDPLLAAMIKRLVVCGGHGKILSVQRLRKLSRAIESRWVSGGRGRHRQGAGQAGSVEADDESYSDGLERYVRAACVSLSRSESSHENAHLRLLRIAWQVMLYSQRLRR